MIVVGILRGIRLLVPTGMNTDYGSWGLNVLKWFV
jgi:hypothetical protein